MDSKKSEKEFLGKKRNDTSKNNSQSNSNNASNNKNNSFSKNDLENKKIQNKNENNNVNKKQSFNSESDESELINKLLEKKINKNTIIKNFNSNNRNTNNKYNNRDNNNSKNNFGIKFSKKSKNNQIDSNEDEFLDKEIDSENINSESDEYIDQKNLRLSEENQNSREDKNNKKNNTKVEFSIGENNKINIKVNKDKRKLVLFQNDVSEESSEEENTNYMKTKKNITSTTSSSKIKNIISEQEENADFIGFKNNYSSSNNKANNNNYDTKITLNNINNKNLNEKPKDITKVDFIAFSKTTKTNNSEDNLGIDLDLERENQKDSLFKSPSNKPLFNQYPWVSKRTSEYKGILKLHYEICDFYNYIKPRKSEFEIRQKSFEILKNLILRKFANWRVKVFGSFPNEIFLADSDVDIVVISNDKKDNAKKTMDKLYDYLYLNSDLFDYIKRIDAKVPIVKMQLKETKINLDISVDRKNGYDAKRIIKKSLNDFHALKPLMYLLKYFMRQKKLNETFSGGISSFLLFNLVLAFLQYKNKTENNPSLNLGQLLVDFFQFYGFEFNYDEVGISVRYGGFFYKRKDKDSGKFSFLSVENFQDISQNIGSGAYKFRKVLDCFKQARDALYYPSTYPINSYLGQFITTDSFLRNRFRFQQDE